MDDTLEVHEKRKAEEKAHDILALKNPEVRKKVNKYDRIRQRPNTKSLKDKKLKSFLKKQGDAASHAATKAARSELLLLEDPGFLETENEMERTYKLQQKDLVKQVDIGSATKFFDLKLDTFGPYSINYTRNGRNILIGGQRGHLATFDWSSKRLGCEFHVQETVRDVQYLHNEQMFAVAQKEYVYIYDKNGVELHRLQEHQRASRLAFLPYHFLLVSAGEYGTLRYHDISTGQMLVGQRTKMGACDSMTFNPSNAIVHCGHNNGTVTLWSPNVREPLVKMLCHRGHVRSVAVDAGGRYMATCGMDAQLRVWDVRTFKPLHAYYTPRPAASMCISQRGLLALVAGREVQVWRDALSTKQKAPYMKHTLASEGRSLEFCPFEDVLGVGHAKGFTSLLIPGAGEPNFDALEVNPFQTKKQRQETEVKQLLEKIPSELISLDPDEILRVDRAEKDTLDKEKQLEAEANQAHRETKMKNRTRGKSALHRTARLKLLEREKKRRDLLQAQLIGKMELKKKEKEEEEKIQLEEQTRKKTALERFKPKPKSKPKKESQTN